MHWSTEMDGQADGIKVARERDRTKLFYENVTLFPSFLLLLNVQFVQLSPVPPTSVSLLLLFLFFSETCPSRFGVVEKMKTTNNPNKWVASMPALCTHSAGAFEEANSECRTRYSANTLVMSPCWAGVCVETFIWMRVPGGDLFPPPLSLFLFFFSNWTWSVYHQRYAVCYSAS